MALSPIDDCVRRTPDSYPIYQEPAPAPKPKTTSEQLQEAVDHLIEGSAEIGRGNPDRQYSNPFDPNAPKINYAPVSFNNKGASVSGPSVLGSYVKLAFNFVVEVVPILWRSDTMQSAINTTTGFIKDTASTVASAVVDASKTVASAVQTAAKEVKNFVQNAASTVASWFSSWF